MAWEAVLALDRKDDVLMRRSKRRFRVAHAVMHLVPDDLALDLEARELHRVDKGLLHVPSGEADDRAARFEHPEGVIQEPDEGGVVVLDLGPGLGDIVDAIGRVGDDRVDALVLHLPEHREAVVVDDGVFFDGADVPHLLNRPRA